MQVNSNVSVNIKYFVLLCCVLFACAFSTDTFSQDNESKNQEWHYTLRPADNFQKISEQILNNKHSWTDLVRHNRIDDIASLEPGSIIRVPMQWLKQQPRPAKILSIAGNAQIKRTKDTHYKVLKANMSIYVGDEVATKNGTLLIKLADNSLIRLEKNSNLVFNKLSHYGRTGMVDTQLRLKKGSLSTEISPLVKGSTYEITTPSAVAAVRGTKFRLETTPNETKLEVTEGSVNFSHQHGTAIVNTGEGARIKQDSPSIERSILPAAPETQFANKVIEDLPTTLKWKGKGKSESYHYELSDSGNTLIQTAMTKKPEVTIDHVKNGDYKVAMRAVNTKGFEGMNQNSMLSIEIPTEVAEQLAPLDGSIIDTTKPTFSWQFEHSNTKGKLEVSDQSDFKRIITNFDFSTSTKASLRKGLAPGIYFWRVSALTNDRQESTTLAREFTVRGLLKPVNILSVNYIDNQVGIFWGNINHAKGYTLQISDSSSFETILKEEIIGKTKAHLRLSSGKRYFARVKGNSDGRYTSEFGPVKELYIKN
ncbi:MAG: hypothetical protein ACI84K_001724 [Pseudohongiellaceae bacterium]|jgi:hypothetical protein